MYTDEQIIEALEIRMPHDAVCREAYDLIQRQRAEVAREIFEDINSLVGEYEMGDIEYPDFRFRLGKIEKKHTEEKT